MYCKNCGKEISNDSAFCHFCGAENRNDSEDDKIRTNKQPITNRWWFIILMLSFVYPFGMFLMWSKKKVNTIVKIILSVIFLFVFINVITGFVSGLNKNNTTGLQTEIKSTKTEKSIGTKTKDINEIITFFNDNLLSDIELYNPNIVDCGVEMNTTDDYIMINIVVRDSTNDETAMDIADTVVRQLNLAANLCDSSKFPIGSKDNYGGLYDKYNAMVGVAPLSKTGDSKAWYIYDAITGGEDMLKLQKKK